MKWLYRTFMISQLMSCSCVALAHGNAPVAAVATDTPLYLNVFINDERKDLIAEFIRDVDGRFRSRAGELTELGLDPGSDHTGSDWVYLDAMPQLSFVYGEAEQQIHITVDPSRTVLKSYNLRGPVDDVPLLRPGTGLAVNYSLSSQFAARTQELSPQFSGASAFMEARAFSPHGVATQSGRVGLDAWGDEPALKRFDTAFSRTFATQQVTANAGDIVSGGLSWSRPIRMGGVQLRRNFGTRPDLITYPLPSLEGTAAVPSTVDIYLGKLRLNSVDVATGRFQLNNLPAPSQNGDLRIVVQDATGALHEQSLPFSTSHALLRPGLVDYSVEVGAARTGYATDRDTYDDNPVAVASLRRGMTDNLTLEGHTELGAGVANAGVGAVTSSSRFGVIGAAVAASTYQGHSGVQLSGTYNYSLGSTFFQLDARHLFGDYSDLADATARDYPDFANPDQTVGYERFQVSTPFLDDFGSVSAGYAHTLSRGKQSGHFLNAAFTRQMGRDAQLSLQAQTQLGGERYTSANLGLSFNLGGQRSASVGTTVSDGKISANLSAAKTLEQKPGSWGYGGNLRRDDSNMNGNLLVNHYGERGQSTGILYGSQDDLGLYGNFEGSAALLNGDVYFARHIDDSFAVVDAGAPGVRVYHENHLIGKTARNGKLLVPAMRAYESNKLAIEPEDLPVNSTISQTNQMVAMPEHSGVEVAFAGEAHADTSAIIVLQNSKGEFLPAGTAVVLDGSTDAAVVGYDGEAFLSHLKPENTATVDAGGVRCHVTFKFEASSTPQRLGPFACL